jgi:hypothetical protein
MKEEKDRAKNLADKKEAFEAKIMEINQKKRQQDRFREMGL